MSTPDHSRTTVTEAKGLTVKYDFTLNYQDQTRPGGTDTADPFPDIVSSVQSQLGLRPEPKKVPVEVMVVDRTEKTPLPAR